MHSGSVGLRCTGRTKAGPAQQFPPPPQKVPGAPSSQQVALLDDLLIYHDLSRRGLPVELATLARHVERISRDC